MVSDRQYHPVGLLSAGPCSEQDCRPTETPMTSARKKPSRQEGPRLTRSHVAQSDELAAMSNDRLADCADLVHVRLWDVAVTDNPQELDPFPLAFSQRAARVI